MNRAARRALRLPKGLLAIDSTTITVEKTRWPWAVYHGERAGIKLHVSYAMETGMPLQVIETTGLKSEARFRHSFNSQKANFIDIKGLSKKSVLE